MTDPSYYRGHRIISTICGTWVYADTRQPVRENPDRYCGHCRKHNTPEGHDGCLGTLPGVMNACCGHGRTEEAYIQYPDGRRISGHEAIITIENLKQS